MKAPGDALERALEWRHEVQQLLQQAIKYGRGSRGVLPDSAVFYVSGGHRESYGSTGHLYDILATTDDVADLVFFSNRKGMNAGFKVKNFGDVIKIAGTSIWAANPSVEQRRLTLLVLHAWISHVRGEPMNCNLVSPQHSCGGVSWLYATAARMEAGALAQDGTTPIGAEGQTIRDANVHAICMWLLKEVGGPIQVEEQRCRLLSDEERSDFQSIHFDCSGICRGRCGFVNGVPKPAITTGQASGTGADDGDCLCTFGGASQCWVPPRAQGASLQQASDNMTDSGTADGTDSNGTLRPEARAPEMDPRAEQFVRDEQQARCAGQRVRREQQAEPELQSQPERDPSAQQLAARGYAPVKRFTAKEAEDMLAYLTTSAVREKIIARAVEDIDLTEAGFADRVKQHSSGRRVTTALLAAIAQPLIMQCRELGHTRKAATTTVFTKMSERISAELRVFTRDDEYKKREAGGEVQMEPSPGCCTWKTSAREGDERINVVLRCPNIDLPVGSGMVEQVSLGQRVMIKTLQQCPELNGQLGTVVKAAEETCTDAENVRVTVRYTSSAISSLHTPALDATGGVPTPQLDATVVGQASTTWKQISVKPRNLAVVMTGERDGTSLCYGTNGTPLGESAVARERRAQSTTDSRRHLADLFAVATEPLSTTPQGRARSETEPAETQAGAQAKSIPMETGVPQDATLTATGPQAASITVTSPAAHEVACMVQEAGFANVLAVEDILEALERDASKVSYVLRAVAWGKLSEEEQERAIHKARVNREHQELPYRPSYSSMSYNSLCSDCDGMLYLPALNADSKDRLRYHMQRHENGVVVHLQGRDLHEGSIWRKCGQYTACDQCTAAQEILQAPLPRHAPTACILGDELLVGALQFHVRGYISCASERKDKDTQQEGGDVPARRDASREAQRDSRSPARASRHGKRASSRSPGRTRDSRPRGHASRSRSPMNRRPRSRGKSRSPPKRSRSPRRRSHSHRRTSRSRSPRRREKPQTAQPDVARRKRDEPRDTEKKR